MNDAYGSPPKAVITGAQDPSWARRQGALGLSLGVPIVSYMLLGWAIDDISIYLEPAANSVSLDLAPEGKGRGGMLSFTHRR